MTSKKKRAELQKLIIRMKDAFSATEVYKSTADDHDARIVRTIYDDPSYKAITQADRAYLSGLRDGLGSALWKHMSWRLGPAEGPLPENVDGWNPPEKGPLSILCRKPGELYGGHFWTGTDKVFTAYKVTNEKREA